VDRLEIRGWGEPGHQDDRRHLGGYGSLQEGQWPNMAQQAAMVRCVVRFFLAGQGEGLSAECQKHQQQHQQYSHPERAVAGRLGWVAAIKQGHTDTMAAQSYAVQVSRNTVGQASTPASGSPDPLLVCSYAKSGSWRTAQTWRSAPLRPLTAPLPWR